MRVSFATALIAAASATALSTAVPEARAGGCQDNYAFCMERARDVYDSCVEAAVELYTDCMNSIPSYCFSEGVGTGTCEQQIDQCRWLLDFQLVSCADDYEGDGDWCYDNFQVCRSRQLQVH